MRHGKSSAGFRELSGASLEPIGMDLGMHATPIERFFVCSAGDAPALDIHAWRLRIDGDAVARPSEVTLDDLAQLPQHELPAWLECAGNGRRLYGLVDGHPESSIDSDTPWLLGGMGMATWSGPRLADVLALAGVVDSAKWVAPAGLDVHNSEGEPVRMCLPIAKALHADTIVATRMHGGPLVSAHGAPARLLVPGWVGAYSVKWLGRLEVSTSWVPSWRADTYYRLRAPDGTDLGPATAHPVKSSLALGWDVELEPGPQRVDGWARSGIAPITDVEWSLDRGPWEPAELAEAAGPWAWTPFSFDVDLAPGRHEIRTRATDATGASQPPSVPFRPNGILWNAVTPHPVVVD